MEFPPGAMDAMRPALGSQRNLKAKIAVKLPGGVK